MAAQAPQDRLPASGRRVLVIDDEESLRHALGKALKRAGYVVETAATGREGVERLRSTSFDAVVTDVRLPDLSGLDVVALLTETRPTVPVLVMTAFGSVETALEAMKRGARDFVTKPFETAALLALLEREIGRAAGGEDARLRVQVERRFAPAAYSRVESEIRREGAGPGAPAGPASREAGSPAAAAASPAPSPAPPSDAVPGEAGLPRAGEEPLELRDAQRRFEIRYVEDLLARTGGNVAAAARLAGISRPNFHKKLKVLGVDPARFKRAHRRGKSAGL